MYIPINSCLSQCTVMEAASIEQQCEFCPDFLGSTRNICFWLISLSTTTDPHISLILFPLLPDMKWVQMARCSAWTEVLVLPALHPVYYLHFHFSITPGAMNLTPSVLSGMLHHCKSYGLNVITDQRRLACRTAFLKCVFWLWFCFETEWKGTWRDISFLRAT